MDNMTIEFNGTVTRAESKQTNRGKAFANLDVQRGYEYKGEIRHEVILLTAWGELATACNEGAAVTVKARVSGREYNGKHYLQLTAVSIKVADNAAPKIEPVAAVEQPAQESADLPF
jgi:hypothetical protein